MNSASLTEILEHQYKAALVVHAFRLAAVDSEKIVLEIEIEIFGEQPSKAFLTISK